MVAPAYNVSTWKAEEDLAQIQGQPGSPCETNLSLNNNNNSKQIVLKFQFL